ncbi:ribose 5-phosphate isomerase B [Hydrogenispora ethanolica]|uniref:Ribose 5-phosphate isomerase B n=1 Tax=Hydrogenispora ethanolica TaxID=1082276 RepID=A0A4R1R1M8_HYDET|nr:ribose 5-phosphate isomerase B [Hydrogenispora ethanolica]TCL59245.1 ribose 5-phosphate isomerase B [Hydrogenispora ethanolica]
MSSIAIGSDEAGFGLKEKIRQFLTDMGFEVKDYGVYDTQPVLYPDIAVRVAQAIAAGHHERGILVCGTGIGMAIAANKVPGVRAAVCHDPYSAERARKSNDAQIMALGARIIGEELAKLLVTTWLHSEFQGGGSTPKVAKITEYERIFWNKQDV